MDIQELQKKMKLDGFFLSTKEVRGGGHYKDLMRFSFAFPTTKAQANFFRSVWKNRAHSEVLNLDDAVKISNFMEKHGKIANFSLTKGNRFARLHNVADYCEALKEEFK